MLTCLGKAIHRLVGSK